MAAIRGKVGLDVGQLAGRSHKTEGKSTRSMDELFRNIGTEKTDWNAVLWERESCLPVSPGGDCLKFFKYFRKRNIFSHGGSESLKGLIRTLI
jgi:hypothetical protein